MARQVTPRRPTALLLSESYAFAARQAAELERRGYEVRCFTDPDEALTLFGRSMPATAVIGPVARTPALELLLDDLALYGIPLGGPGSCSAH